MSVQILASQPGLKRVLKGLVPYCLWPSSYLKRLVLRRTQGRVRFGPFKDLKYVEDSTGSAYLPKILGTYERELSSVVNEIIADDFDRVVDVGAAEGYYAAGFAMRCPRAAVIAFEMVEKGRKLLREMAEANGFGHRVEIRDRCNPESLAAALEPPETRTVLICDCEGYERELLDPERISALRRTAILVELHDCFDRGISACIRTRFEFSHTVEEILEQGRHWREFPYSTFWTRLMPRSCLSSAVAEFREERMHWFWMKPRLLP